MQEEYEKADRWMKLRHSGAFITVDGIYVMINGQPYGEQGLRWWVYKVVSAMNWRMHKKREKEGEYAP